MHLESFWHGFIEQAGNQPGAQQGDVTVTLLQPVGGIGEFTVPSDSVTIAAEAGNLIGLQTVVEGRRIFVMATNVAGIVDALPEGAGKPAGGRRGAAAKG